MSRANLPAYPNSLSSQHIDGVIPAGLTIREHFASMAMQGALGGAPGPHLISANLASESVAHADALIAELAKPKKAMADVGTDIESYLVERIEWLGREIKNGGHYQHLSDRKTECAYLLQNVREIRARQKT